MYEHFIQDLFSSFPTQNHEMERKDYVLVVVLLVVWTLRKISF